MLLNVDPIEKYRVIAQSIWHKEVSKKVNNGIPIQKKL